jgi:hypothetical protein
MSIISSFHKIKGYIPYLYSCLISAYSFGTLCFILILSETEILNNNFFWQDSSSYTLGVLSFISVAATFLVIPILSSILTYNYSDKIIEKLHISNKKLPLLTLGTIAPLCLSLASSGALSSCYNISFKKVLIYLNQMVLKKFYNIPQYARLVLKI